MVVLDFSSGAQKIIMLLAIGFIAYLILFTLFFVTRNSVVFLKKAYNRQQGGNINPAFYTSAALAGGVLLFSVFAKGFLEPPSLDAPRSLFEDLRWYDYMFWSAAMIFSFLYIVLKILERRVNAAN